MPLPRVRVDKPRGTSNAQRWTPGTTQTASVVTVDQWGRPLLAAPSHRFGDAFDFPTG